MPRAAVIVAETSALSDAAAAAVATAIIRAASGMTTGQLRAELHRLVIFMDPAAALRRKEAAQKQARVELWRENAGTCALSGRDLPPGLALAADKHLTAAAEYLKAQGADGTLSQLRARAYLGLLCGLRVEFLLPANRAGQSTGQPGMGQPEMGQPGMGQPGAGRRAASPPAAGQDSREAGCETRLRAGTGGATWPALAGSVNLTLPLATWLGWSQSPGDVPGFGPLDAADSRAVGDALARHPGTQWCLTLLGPGSRPVAHGCAGKKRPPPAARPDPPGPPDQPDPPGPPDLPGRPDPPDVAALSRWLAGLRLASMTGPCDHAKLRVRYRPSAKLQHLVRVRRRTCTFPGCRQPARRCDLDHTIAFDRGGVTCLCNLGPLCRRHHRCKQAEGWGLSQGTSGEFIWTTPSGRRYITRPAAYPQ